MSEVTHLQDGILERYAMNKVTEAEAESVEDHLALCSHCLDRLDETSAFVNGMREAIKALPPEQARFSFLPDWIRSGWAMPAWGLGAAAAAALLFVTLRPGALPPAATVMLEGTRGTATVVHGTGPFDFELFMPVDGKTYHVELLDGGGQRQWEADVPGTKGKVHALVNKKLELGQYFLQVTEPGSGSKREYAVEVTR